MQFYLFILILKYLKPPLKQSDWIKVGYVELVIMQHLILLSSWPSKNLILVGILRAEHRLGGVGFWPKSAANPMRSVYQIAGP